MKSTRLERFTLERMDQTRLEQHVREAVEQALRESGLRPYEPPLTEDEIRNMCSG